MEERIDIKSEAPTRAKWREQSDESSAWPSLLPNNLALSGDEIQNDGASVEPSDFQIDGLSSLVALVLEHNIPLLSDGMNSNASMISVTAGSGAFNTVEISRLSVDISSSAFSSYGEQHLFGRGYAEGQKIAIKRVARESRGRSGASLFAAIANEVRIIAHPTLRNCENIVDVIGLGFTGSCHDNPRTDYRWPLLALEFADCGTLEDFFGLEDIVFTWTVKRDIAYDVLNGLEALDNACVLHGDLKFTNVLVFRTGPDCFVAKLCDFGTALIATDHDSDVAIRDVVHTPPWNAPEILDGIMVDEFHKVDLYSFGLLVYRIFTEGDDPFSRNALRGHNSAAATNEALILNWKLNDEVRTLCKRGVRRSDKARFTIDQFSVLDAVFDLTVRTDPEMRADEYVEIKSLLRPELSEMELERRDNVFPGEIMSAIVPTMFWNDLVRTVPSIERCFNSLLPRNIASEIFEDLQQVAKISKSKLEIVQTQDRLAAAARELSHAYIQGFGCDVSYQEAASWLTHSVELGSREAQDELTRMLGAMEIPLPLSSNNSVFQMMLANAKSGSPSSLDELRIRDQSLYHNVKQELRTEYAGMGIDIFGDDTRAAYPLDDSDEFMRRVGHLDGKVPLGEDEAEGLTWLHYAASNGSTAAVRALLQQGSTRVNCSSENNKWTPLYMACCGGHIDAAEALLDYDADATAVSAAERTCLHNLHMFDAGDIPRIVQRLLDGCADIEATDRLGNTPLFTACISGHGEAAAAAISALVERGANPLKFSSSGFSSIDIAAIYVRPDLLHILLSSSIFEGVANASISPRANALRRLIKAPKFHRLRNGGASYQRRLNETLQLLISEEVVRAYIDGSPQKLTPLQDASIWGSSDLIKPLCAFRELNINAFRDDNHDSHYTNLPPLFEALKFDNEKLVQVICDEHADITVSDSAGRNVLHFTVEFAPRFLATFVSRLTGIAADIKAFVNAPTRIRNFTPFDIAVLSHRFGEADRLIQLGAQYKEFTRTGASGELYSSLGFTGGSRRQMSYFLDMPPGQRPTSVVCNYGFTLFHLTAASFDNALLETDPSPADNVTFLLEHYFSKADANQPDFAGNTPLHTAVLCGNIAVARMLLEGADADVNAKTKLGSTPLDKLDRRLQAMEQPLEEQILVDDLEKRIWKRRNAELERLLQSYGGVRGA